MPRLLNPPLYQGPRNFQHKKGYFEGWYYKFVSPDNKAYAVIPGVSLSKEQSTAFIQTIDGSDGTTSYHEFPLSELEVTYNPHSVRIGKNLFTLEKVVLGDRIPLSGEIELINPAFYKSRLSRPGIMGWYRYVPFMECYHGVVSMGHGLQGSLETDKGKLDFTEGRGYIEKDWGTSFPSSYIWMQSNSFPEHNVSFMLSLARIPWFGSWFRGFLGFFRQGDRVVTFSTYTGAELQLNSVGPTGAELTVRGRELGGVLKISASRIAGGELMAPQIGSMNRRISESIDGHISLDYSKGDKVLYKGTSASSGLEIVGDMEELS